MCYIFEQSTQGTLKNLENCASFLTEMVLPLQLGPNIKQFKCKRNLNIFFLNVGEKRPPPTTTLLITLSDDLQNNRYLMRCVHLWHVQEDWLLWRRYLQDISKVKRILCNSKAFALVLCISLSHVLLSLFFFLFFYWTSLTCKIHSFKMTVNKQKYQCSGPALKILCSLNFISN